MPETAVGSLVHQPQSVLNAHEPIFVNITSGWAVSSVDANPEAARMIGVSHCTETTEGAEKIIPALVGCGKAQVAPPS